MRKNFSFYLLSFFSIILFSGISISAAGTFTVVNTNDNGAGSLRAAIIGSNTHQGADSIKFSIEGAGPHVISTHYALPGFTDAVFVDGFSQKGAYHDHLKIIITCSHSSGELNNGLSLLAGSDHSVIAGLVVNNNKGYGIYIDASNFSRIEGNYIGTDVNGKSSQGNVRGGIVITNGAHHVTIGGNLQTKRNVVSGNSRSGIVAENHSHDIVIIGNYIGTDYSGSVKIPNLENGIFIESSLGVSVGGVKPGESNVVSGNGKSGIAVVANSGKVLIRNNFLGTNASGTGLIGNKENGVFIEHSGDGIIGGSLSSEKNVICGNEKSGISIISQSNMVQIKGNYLGILSDGKTEGGNLENGVFVEESKDILIGGPRKEDRNIISANKQTGIDVIKGSDRTQIMGNLIGFGVDGVSSKGNCENGVFIENSANVQIGGASIKDGNIIGNNKENGIYIRAAKNCILNNNCLGWVYDKNIHSLNLKNAVLIKKSIEITLLNNKILGNGPNGGISSISSEKIYLDNNYSGVFYTILLLMILVNIFFYTIFRNDNFMYYLLYIAVIGLIIINLNGVVYDLFWPEWINNKVIMVAAGVAVLVFSIYTFFNLKRMDVEFKTNKNLFKLLVGCGLLFIVSIFINSYKVEIIFSFLLILFSLAFVLQPGRQFLKKRYLPAVYYLLALMVMGLSTIIQTFSHIGIIPHYESLGDFWQIVGAFVEFTLFSVGLGFQINLLKSENEKARSQIEEYLKVINLQQVQEPVVIPAIEQVQTVTPEYQPFEYKIKAADVANYDLSPLTDRELEVLSLIASGKANKEIADQLFVSVNTIKSHIQKIYEKLDVNNRIQALAKANSLNIFKKP